MGKMKLLAERNTLGKNAAIAENRRSVATSTQVLTQYITLLDVADGFLKRMRTIGELRRIVKKLI
jgi:hypothetical protein